MNKNPFFQLLKISDFLKIWGSQILNQTTLSLINFVIVLKIFGATGSTVAISLVWIFYVLPTLLLGPFSGTVIDFVERRRVMLLTNILEAVIILFYLLVKTKIWPIYGVVFLYSLVYQFYMPAEAATLPRVVPKRLLPSANTLFLFTIYGAMFVGFSLAGPMVAALGGELPFILGTFFMLAAAGVVSLLPKSVLNVNNKIGGPQQFWRRFKSGYLFISERPEIFFPLALLVLTQVIISPLLLLAPSYATEILKMNLLHTSLVFIVPLGLGGLMGAQIVILALRRIRKIRVINTALLMASAWLLVLGLFIPFAYVSWRLVLTILALLFLGGSYVGLIIPAQTLIQEKTPASYRGRIFGALFFSINLGLVLSIFLNATITDLLGASWAMTAVGVIVGIMWVFSFRDLTYYGVVLLEQAKKLRGAGYGK